MISDDIYAPAGTPNENRGAQPYKKAGQAVCLLQRTASVIAQINNDTFDPFSQ